MKIGQKGKHGKAAIALLDCMVYMAVFSLLLSMTFLAFHRFSTNSQRLRQNASDIAQAIHAGELWREDIRKATGEIRIEENQNQTILRIPQNSGDATYAFRDNAIERTRGGAQPAVLLKNVKASQMVPENRQHVTAWLWEVELNSRQKNAKVRPLFSFQAVVALSKE